MDRKQIVERHDPVIKRVEPLAPLSIGNGEFGFSFDFTGLQTYPDAYESPLGTQSNWGWHYTRGRELFTDKDIRFQSYDTYGRQVKYPMKPEDKEEAYHWLRQNPHRLQLGRISFRFFTEDHHEIPVEAIDDIHQQHYLWTGIVESRYKVDGIPVTVKTACHPKQDVISVKIESSLLKSQRIQVFTLFPSPDMTDNSWAKAIFPDWNADDRHRTEIVQRSEHSVILKRTLDEDSYQVRWTWEHGELEQTDRHEFTLSSDGESAEMSFTVAFSAEEPVNVDADEVFSENEKHWASFWKEGGAIDFSGSPDPRAFELERRVVLSQYLCAIHSGGSLPPQETGYMYNSWFGKFHLEMHWWHSAHFPLWGRAEILGKSLDWYNKILPLARDLAESQGYEGARWPKMVGIDGKQSPSPVAPGLIWQQPHPIALAELYYQDNPTRERLEKYKNLIFESADFMASFAHWDEEKRAYVLGPPLIPAQECHQMQESLNPPYELEYWKYGLEIAIKWAERLKSNANPSWSKVAQAMSPPPAAEGVYLAHEHCEQTYTEKNHDHPSMVGALGILSGTLIDKEMMRNTLRRVLKVWDWESAWGWDFPMCAMTAARLGEKEMAVDFLMMEATKNTYLPNGHNYQRPGLTAYLPGNGGLLAAVAMMASGWKDAPDSNCPGFPNDGTWKIEHEGLNAWL
ncbi:glycoside hydrolase family 65 [Lederbergia sp. NSJ-179]|uniref:glycoside hydrolase family 65 n=1 Tax=Lederbergia sp. NSJ-179 TaxID=2931402 RepID=UPI001FD467B8|nr:glycoside hydrolase family 65 [Lederbergia sp. NSJ-179]MCJ7840251.1 glycoside hydrolase family 65 [Lederbergia sp. NSJ-179]